jgi:hypothetical protein
MMNFSDETLMAYADGELSAAERTEIETAMAQDTQMARRIAEHKALRFELGAAFAGVIQEDIPNRLTEAVRLGSMAPDFDAGRQPQGNASAQPKGTAGKSADIVPLRQRNPARGPASKRPWAWPEWTALAATLVLGVIAGNFWRQPGSTMIAAGNEGLLATGTLAHALSEQLAGTQSPDDPVQVGLSFRDKSGDYCRSFVTHANNAVAGVACRNGSEWRLSVLAQGASHPLDSQGYRMAATSLPPAVLKAIEERIEGEPLSAQDEQAARKDGWKTN